jgi:HIV Tat-specific factor 1
MKLITNKLPNCRRLREHCSRFGTVRKVIVYDKNGQGICQVFFATPEEADGAIPMLDGRMFNSNSTINKLSPMKAYTWDGKTKYKINESEEEEKARLANWDTFLQETETAEIRKTEETKTTAEPESEEEQQQEENMIINE